MCTNLNANRSKAVRPHLLVNPQSDRKHLGTITGIMATANLPAISHPISRLENPEKINVRGISRYGTASSQFRHELEKVDRLRPITADQMPWRLTKSSHGTRNSGKLDTMTVPALGTLPEGVEMKRAHDQSKPAIPIFGMSYVITYVLVVSIFTFGFTKTL